MDKFTQNYRKKSRSRDKDSHQKKNDRRNKSAERDERQSRRHKRSPSSSYNSSSKSSSLLSSQESNKAGDWNVKRQKFQDGLKDRQPILVPNVPNQNNPPEESYDQWKAKEDQFHLEQAILRSKIRIESNREKPIDFIAKVILIIEGKLTVTSDFISEDYKNPFNIFKLVQTSAELKELKSDMQTFLNAITSNNRFQQYWQSMQILCTLEIDKKLKIEQQEKSTDEQSQLLLLKQSERDQELERDAQEMIADKDLNELMELKKEIEDNLAADRSFALELQYWSNVLNKIDERVAVIRVETIYADYVSQNKEQIDADIKLAIKRKSALIKDKDVSKNYQTPFTALKINNTMKGMMMSNTEPQINGDEALTINHKDKDAQYNDGTLSPILIPFDEAGYLLSLATNDELIQAEQEALKKEFIFQKLKLILAKQQEEGKHQDKDSNLTAVEKVKKTALNTLVRFDIDSMGFDNSSINMYEELKRKGVGQDEEEFTDILQSADINSKLPIQKYDWEDKYKPRKPRFFNTVQTGYEWNKYNQTHYDVDNPPPKTVQGYKFNIFYPDLIDKTKTPQYFLETSDTPNTLVIRFNAGPPYEDIAFKIINKEWEMSERHGFKCVFDRGVLYLHFSFKKHRYRR